MTLPNLLDQGSLSPLKRGESFTWEYETEVLDVMNETPPPTELITVTLYQGEEEEEF